MNGEGERPERDELAGRQDGQQGAQQDAHPGAHPDGLRDGLRDERQGDALVAEYLRELEREAARLSWNARNELLEDVRSHIEVALSEAEIEDGSSTVDAVGDASATSSMPSRTLRIRRILSALGEPREIVDAAVDEPVLVAAGAASGAGTSAGTGAVPPDFVPHPLYGASGYPYQYSALPGPPYPLGARETLAVIFLLIGGLFWGFGWFIGLILLWGSPRWNLRERLVGTLLVPGGLGLALLMVAVPTSTKSCVAESAGTDGASFEHCTTSGFTLPGWIALPLLLLLFVVPLGTAFYLVRAARNRPGNLANARRIGGGAAAGITAAAAVVLVLLVGMLVASHGGEARQPATPVESQGVAPVAESSGP